MEERTGTRAETAMPHLQKSRIDAAHPTGVQGQCKENNLEEGQGAVATGVAPMAQYNNRDHTRYWACITARRRRAASQRARSYENRDQRLNTPATNLNIRSQLIWVLRCEQVIHRENRQHTDQEVNARWLKIINDRLTSDRITATKIKRDQKFTRLVNAT
jgi:hypothetical protein